MEQTSRTDYACAILLRDRSILLGLRAPHRRAYPNRWDVFGGRVERGETPEAALRRELSEELGIEPLDAAILASVDDDDPGARGTSIYHFFVVRSWAGEAAIRNHEHTAIAWHTIESACALPNLAHPGYPALFERLEDAYLRAT